MCVRMFIVVLFIGKKYGNAKLNQYRAGLINDDISALWNIV
jgi:hypothetical protein